MNDTSSTDSIHIIIKYYNLYEFCSRKIKIKTHTIGNQLNSKPKSLCL